MKPNFEQKLEPYITQQMQYKRIIKSLAAYQGLRSILRNE